MESVLELERLRLRRMTASEKIGVLHLLWRQAWSLKVAGARAQHPDWPAERVDAAFREIFRHGRP